MQQVSRRQFARVLAGLAAAPAFANNAPVALQAIAGPRLPHTILVPGINSGAALFELRVYGSRSRGMPAVLERHGIRPALRIGAAYLIPFESLQARQQAWDAVNADPDWHALRANGPVNVKEISLYRVAHASSVPRRASARRLVRNPG